jgi:peptidyl-prolyl cis-trans isomerase SurA
MLDQLIGANDPATFYSTAAQQGLSRADVFEAVRELQVLQGIAVEKGLLDLSDQALQKLYQQSLQQTVHLGYITVPDQATADAVLAQLTADPASYPQVAAQHAGPNTLSSVESRTADQIPGLLADGVRAAQPGTGFTLAVPQIGVVVAFVADPTFAQVRPDLVQQATVQSYPAALKLVTAVRDDLDLSVNPRYGVVQTAGELPTRGDVVQLAPGTCGVVRQAGAAADACSAESAAGN